MESFDRVRGAGCRSGAWMRAQGATNTSDGLFRVPHPAPRFPLFKLPFLPNRSLVIPLPVGEQGLLFEQRPVLSLLPIMELPRAHGCLADHPFYM